MESSCHMPPLSLWPHNENGEKKSTAGTLVASWGSDLCQSSPKENSPGRVPSGWGIALFLCPGVWFLGKPAGEAVPPAVLSWRTCAVGWPGWEPCGCMSLSVHAAGVCSIARLALSLPQLIQEQALVWCKVPVFLKSAKRTLYKQALPPGSGCHHPAAGRKLDIKHKPKTGLSLCVLMTSSHGLYWV